MTLDQYADLQADILALQKLALKLHEMGQSKASADGVRLVARLQRIKPTKPSTEPAKTGKAGAK